MSKKFRVAHLIITSFPVFWFPFIVNWLGEYLFLVEKNIDNEKCLTALGWFLSSAVVIAVIFAQILFFIKNHNIEYESLVENYKILNRVGDSLFNIAKDKYKNLIEYVDDNRLQLRQDSFYQLCHPVDNINKILEEMTNLFTNILNIRSNNIGVTFAYMYSDDKKWQWFDDSNVEDGLSLDELVNNKHTTFYQIVSGKFDWRFHASKKKAHKAGEYVFDKKDNENNCVGSIICAKVTCGKHKSEYVICILNISTYGKEILKYSENTKKVETFLRESILDQYFIRIKIELAMLHAKHVADKNSQ